MDEVRMGRLVWKECICPMFFRSHGVVICHGYQDSGYSNHLRAARVMSETGSRSSPEPGSHDDLDSLQLIVCAARR